MEIETEIVLALFTGVFIGNLLSSSFLRKIFLSKVKKLNQKNSELLFVKASDQYLV